MKNFIAKTAAGVSALALTAGTALAQTAPTSPLEVLQSNSAAFMDETKAVLFAGAGLLIGAYLVKALVNTVIQFFRRG